MKEKHEKSNVDKKSMKNTIIGMAIIVIGIVVILLLVLPNRNKVELDFNSEIAMYVSEDEPVTLGEYLIYAASITQEATTSYGEEVWNEVVNVSDDEYVTFEEYTRQMICEQIRLTHLLSKMAGEYGVTLTEEETAALSEDAQAYYESLQDVDVAEIGIDLALILEVYKENMIAEKVYNKIVEAVERTDEMYEEEYEEACFDYFEKQYNKICKQYSKNWSYTEYVNMEEINAISFASTVMTEDEEEIDENALDATFTLESLVGMENAESEQSDSVNELE